MKYFVAVQMEGTVAFIWQQCTFLYGSPLYMATMHIFVWLTAVYGNNAHFCMAHRCIWQQCTFLYGSPLYMATMHIFVWLTIVYTPTTI
jgi:hypothetical protein